MPLEVTEASFTRGTFASARAGLTLPYRLFVPRGCDVAHPCGLVLFLHGAGERGRDNRRQLVHGALPLARAAARATPPAIVLVPQCPDGAQWVQTPWAGGSYSIEGTAPSAPMVAVIDLLAEIRRALGPDPQRLLLTGISMGGYGVWDLGLRHPELFAAALPICGAGDPARAGRLAATPVWAFHGERDPVVPVEGSRAMVRALEAAGAPVKYTEYAGAEHHVWARTYDDPAVLAWFFAQRRGPVTAGAPTPPP
jgi:predicted peptidase